MVRTLTKCLLGNNRLTQFFFSNIIFYSGGRFCRVTDTLRSGILDFIINQFR